MSNRERHAKLAEEAAKIASVGHDYITVPVTMLKVLLDDLEDADNKESALIGMCAAREVEAAAENPQFAVTPCLRTSEVRQIVETDYVKRKLQGVDTLLAPDTPKPLLEIAEKIARASYDGHLTIFRFTTNWRVMFGTPCQRLDIDHAYEGKTLDEALQAAIKAEGRRALEELTADAADMGAYDT